MSFGIQIKNSQGNVLIDGVHPHPVLHHEASFTLPSVDFDGYASIRVPFPPTAHAPTFAFHTENGHILAVNVSRNSNGEFDEAIILIPAEYPGGGSVDMRVYVAGPVGEPTSNHGIEVFGPTGERVFHSDMKTLRVHDMGTVEMPRYDASVWVEFPPTPEKPYIHLSSMGHYEFEWLLGADKLFIPFLGPVEKNQAGEYYRFLVTGRKWWYPRYYINDGTGRWRLPWVVFT